MAAVAAALLTWAVLPASPPQGPDQVPQLIRQLGNAEYIDRQEAMKKLEALGEDVLPALHEVIGSDADADVQLRACVVVKSIEARVWGQARAFGPGAGLRAPPPGGGYWFNRVAFCGDGRHCVVGGGAVIVFDPATGKEVRRALEVGGARPGLALSKDGKLCLTGHANDATMHLLEVPSLRQVQVFRGHESGILGVALAADGKVAASASRDGTTRLWEVATGKETRRLVPQNAGTPQAVAFSPNGKQLLVSYQGPQGEFVVRRWDVATGKELATYKGHTSNVTHVGWRPDGRTFLSASQDGTLRLWDVKSGRELRRMAHRGGVHDAAVSPDGRRALSAGFKDRVVRLWDLETGRQVRALGGHVWRVLGVTFAPDGRRALSTDGVACVRLWKLGK
jgi:WD40 repeat protein